MFCLFQFKYEKSIYFNVYITKILPSIFVVIDPFLPFYIIFAPLLLETA